MIFQIREEHLLFTNVFASGIDPESLTKFTVVEMR
jgi:hypothetical protein